MMRRFRKTSIQPRSACHIIVPYLSFLSIQLSRKMSGLEIAGLAVGVLPILFEVVKSYSIIRDKIRTFRRCNQELEDVFVEFKAIRVIFLNEVRLLLRSTQNKKQAKLDLEECNNRRWANQETEDRFRAVLQDNYDACREIIQHISRFLEEIASELENFDPFLSQKLPVRPDFKHTKITR